ncbi:MAG TPA: hypothetical protein VMH88_05005 [Gemmatimonadales bacterium]|nr:hypothetical protein [Gemmatimonadales bacterium]
MSFVFEIDAERREVRIVGSGPSNFRETARFIERGIHGHHYEPDYAIFIDLRALEYVPSLAEARRFATMFRSLHNVYGGPMAVLVQTAVGFGMASLIAVLIRAIGYHMRAFQHPEEARAWLDQAKAKTRVKPSP